MDESIEYFDEEFSPTPLDPDESNSDDGGETDPGDESDESVPYNPADFQSPEERAAADRERDEEAERREQMMLEEAITNSLSTVTATAPKSQEKTEKSDSKPALNTSLNETHSLDEGKTCQICFENYSENGEHRCSCLPCGHVFGKRCLELWLSEPNQRKCPICKKKCEKKNIIVLFLKCFAKASETGECDELRAKLARTDAQSARQAEQLVKSKRQFEQQMREKDAQINRLLLENNKSKRNNGESSSYDSGEPSTSTGVARKRTRAQTRSNSIVSTVDDGRPQLTILPPPSTGLPSALNDSLFDNGIGGTQAPPPVIDIDSEPDETPAITAPVPSGSLINLPRTRLLQSRAPIILTEEESKSRAMCYSSFVDMIFVACPQQPPFTGYGYKKISLTTGPTTASTTALPSVHCHTSIVRSMSMSPGRTGYILTSSMDKTIVETQSTSGDKTMTIRTPTPVFSCTYSTADNSRRFVYAGGVDGVLRVYDCAQLRGRENATPQGNFSRAKLEIREPELRGNITEVLSVLGNGILVMRGDCIRLYMLNDDLTSYECHVLVEGKPKAMTWVNDRLLITMSPHGSQTRVQHEIHSIAMDRVGDRQVYTTSLLATFTQGLGQTMCTRTSLHGDHAYIVEQDEHVNKLHVFRASTGAPLASVRLSIPRGFGAYQVVAVAEDKCFVLGGGRLAVCQLRHD